MRKYDAIDAELVKRAPRTLTEVEFANLGRCEYRMRTGRNSAFNSQLCLHHLIRAARQAYRDEGLPCPWDDDYNRLPEFNDILPGYAVGGLERGSRVRFREFGQNTETGKLVLTVDAIEVVAVCSWDRGDGKRVTDRYNVAMLEVYGEQASLPMFSDVPRAAKPILTEPTVVSGPPPAPVQEAKNTPDAVMMWLHAQPDPKAVHRRKEIIDAVTESYGVSEGTVVTAIDELYRLGHIQRPRDGVYCLNMRANRANKWVAAQ